MFALLLLQLLQLLLLQQHLLLLLLRCVTISSGAPSLGAPSAALQAWWKRVGLIMRKGSQLCC